MEDFDLKSVKVLRSELNNIRKQIEALKHQHRKDVARMKSHVDALSLNQIAAEKTSISNACQNDEESVCFRPIGYINSCHDSKNGSPRQPAASPSSCGTLSLVPMSSHFNNAHYALENLIEFSHIWIIFVFHKNQPGFAKTKVAPPRLNGKRVGIFSTRSPHRPNPIGLTLAKIESVDKLEIKLSGIDLISGTPVLDIKPYIQKYDAPGSTLEKPDVCGESNIKMAEWISIENNIKVVFTTRANEMLRAFPCNALKHFKDVTELRAAIVDVLGNDPRSTYRRQKCSDKLYYFDIDQAHITAWFDKEFDNEIAEVLKVELKV